MNDEDWLRTIDLGIYGCLLTVVVAVVVIIFLF